MCVLGGRHWMTDGLQDWVGVLQDDGRVLTGWALNMAGPSMSKISAGVSTGLSSNHGL